MEIYEFLSDYGALNHNTFNGLLSDYVESHSTDPLLELFEKMVEVNPEVRVYVNFELKILHELVSNKKIGYRDIVKVPEGYAKIPYLLYWHKETTSQCMLINTNSYIEARGMYYCMTEPGNVFEPFKYSVLSLYAHPKNENDVLKTFTILQSEKTPSAMIQRRLDDWNIADVDEMHENCVNISNRMFKEIAEVLKGMETKQRTDIIYNTVTRAFLLKKALYVRYMSNKNILNDRHSGNSVEQRRFAKAYIDDVNIVPFYSLWNDEAKED